MLRRLFSSLRSVFVACSNVHRSEQSSWRMVKSKSLDDIAIAFESICYSEGGLATNFATVKSDISQPYFFTNPNIFPCAIRLNEPQMKAC